MYTPEVMDYFTDPRNVGEMEDPSGVGETGNPVCGDVVRIYVDVDERDVIRAVRFKTFGCVAAVATSSMITEMAEGKDLHAAAAISNADVAEALGGLPQQKMHCSNMAADALRLAIQDHLVRSGRAAEAEQLGGPRPEGR